MSKVSVGSDDLRKTRNHVESMVKKKREEKNGQIERIEKQQRALSTAEVSKPPSDEYRDNYEKIFGHK